MRWFAIPLLLAGCGRPEGTVVFAAASLQETARGIAERWGRPVRLQFSSSSTLARQIGQGAPADLFLSANPRWAEEVGGLERIEWLGNRLACVVPKDAPDPDLRTIGSLALATEGTPIGDYAVAALRGMDIPLPPRVVRGATVRDVLSKVSQGAAPAGIVYTTDVAVDPGVRQAFLLPEESHPPIVYVAVLLTERGRPLFEALREPWALEIAARRGFTAR